jgi:hypothetical protein
VLYDRLAGFAGRVIANVDVAIAHDRSPLLRVYANARHFKKVACRLEFESTAPVLRFTAVGLPTGFVQQG